MRYMGEFMSNFSGAIQSGDYEFQQDMILDRIAHVINTEPRRMHEALRKAGVSSSMSKTDLVRHASEQLFVNPVFQHEIAKEIGEKMTNASGDAQINAAPVDPVSAIAAAVGNIAGIFQSQQQKKVAQEQSKAILYEKVFGSQQKKSNWIPVIVVGSVLVIAAIVVVVSLKKK